MDASRRAPQSGGKERDREGPGVGASRWAPKSEGGKEIKKDEGRKKSMWHLRRLKVGVVPMYPRRRRRRRHPSGRQCVMRHFPRPWVVVKWGRGRGKCLLRYRSAQDVIPAGGAVGGTSVVAELED